MIIVIDAASARCRAHGRLWRAGAAADSAGAYEHRLRNEIRPELDAVEGCLGAYVMRRSHGEEVEFVVLHFFDSTDFDSTDAVRRFAGDNHETAVVPEPARKLLTGFDATARHCEVRAEPAPANS